MKRLLYLKVDKDDRMILTDNHSDLTFYSDIRYFDYHEGMYFDDINNIYYDDNGTYYDDKISWTNGVQIVLFAVYLNPAGSNICRGTLSSGGFSFRSWTAFHEKLNEFKEDADRQGGPWILDWKIEDSGRFPEYQIEYHINEWLKKNRGNDFHAHYTPHGLSYFEIPEKSTATSIASDNIINYDEGNSINSILDLLLNNEIDKETACQRIMNLLKL